MRSDVISIDFLSQSITDNLNQQTSKIIEKIDKETKKISRQSIKIVQSNSPVRYGIYKSSFKLKKLKQGKYLIYSAKRYQLTHLLEHGHILKNGAISKAIPHIVKGEEYAQKELPAKIEKIIKENV